MRCMKVLVRSFLQMLSQIKRDPMLVMSLIAPILAGVAFRFLIPWLEEYLCDQFQMIQCIRPYYLLIDLFLVMLAPTMFCFASSMVILMEVDDKIANYYFVTPVGKTGYLTGRLWIPALLGGIYSTILLSLFHLTQITWYMAMIYIILATIISVIVCLMVVSLSSNKVEGMAMTKLSGLLLVGVMVPFFVKHPIQYITAFLPSFWFGKFAMSSCYWFLISCVVTSVLWIVMLYRHFNKKLVF